MLLGGGLFVSVEVSLYIKTNLGGLGIRWCFCCSL